ncbi:hypothetical protein CLU88_0025 [Acidovorax sp. 56]|nr:hypothetical protein CLU88_0025 [Acidovorax sp. 56]
MVVSRFSVSRWLVASYPFGLSLPALSLVEGSKPGRFPPTVRAEPVEAGACGLIRQCAWVEGGSRVVAPAGDSLFFASPPGGRPKKSKQKKGDPKSATPALRFGANLRRSGCGVRRRTHCAPAAHRSNSCGKSVHEARALRRACHPATAPAQAQPQGVDSRAAEQPHGPLLRSASWSQRAAHARSGPSEAMARMDVRWVPFCACREAQGRGCVRVPQDTRTSCTDLPQLFERSAQRAVSSAAHRLPEHRRLPAAQRRDAHSRVALSLVPFFGPAIRRRRERKGLAHRGDIPASDLQASMPHRLASGHAPASTSSARTVGLCSTHPDCL